MNPHHEWNLLAAIALCVMLASCSPGPQAGGGIGGTGQIASVASGPITGFGSVFVSGTEYDTTHTSMMIDGKPGSQRELQKGMIVRVNATVTGRSGSNEVPLRVATRLLYEDTLEGLVQSVATDGSHLVVLGQTVTVTSTTRIDTNIPGGTVLSLVPDRDLVEISGFVTGDGVITGTYVGLKTFDTKTETPDYQVKGFIKKHQPDQKTFEIGGLTVDYRDAVLNDLPGQPTTAWDGLLINVSGKQISSGSIGSSRTRITAALVSQEGLGSDESEGAEIEGFVTRVLNAEEFAIGNLHVLTSAKTRFEGGVPSDIQLGVHVEVHGPLVGGIVQATAVEFEREPEVLP